MFLSIWNYYRGYVIIEVSGFSVERFMNLAAHKGVYIWDVRKSGSAVQMKVSIAGFRLLKQCAKKTKCRIKIIQKHGWPFVAHRYRKRKLFAMGIIVCLVVLYLLSSFIWMIDIQGNDRLSAEDILQVLEKNGAKIGVWKQKVKVDDLELQLMEDLGDISWVAIEIKGTRMNIDIVETVPTPKFLDKSIPCDIIAEKEGVILSIATSSGTPQVRAKDVVEKGDVLVSGEILVKEDEEGKSYNYVHAMADIKVKRWYTLEYNQPLTYIEKNYTDQIKHRYQVKIIDKTINLFKPSISFENYDKISNNKRLTIGKDFILPIQWIDEEYHQYNPVQKEYDMENAKALCQKAIEKKLKEQLPEDAEVISKDIQYTLDKKVLKASATLAVIEYIGQEQKINIEERRMQLNGTDGETDSNTQ